MIEDKATTKSWINNFMVPNHKPHDLPYNLVLIFWLIHIEFIDWLVQIFFINL